LTTLLTVLTEVFFYAINISIAKQRNILELHSVFFCNSDYKAFTHCYTAYELAFTALYLDCTHTS